MTLIHRFRFFMKTSVGSLLDKMQDPERMIEQLIFDMEEQLEAVRASVAAAMADEVQLERQVAHAREETGRWRKRAEHALDRDDEPSARAALEQKLSAAGRCSSLEEELEQQKLQTARLRTSVRELEDRVRQARQKRTLLLARLLRADTERQVHRTLGRSSEPSALAEFRRLETRVDRAEAMSEAWQRLDADSDAPRDLDAQFEASERRERLEKEFAELKRRLADDADDQSGAEGSGKP